MESRAGIVYLVGAGPGDPGLLTVRAWELLAAAEVVVHDALVHPAIIESLGSEVERIFVGKRGGRPSIPQEEIEAILIREAGKGRIVVRLKGGDPFVFGRGGEEGLALRDAGITFEVVPGVTAGVAATAYAGIPVTHRGITSSVTFLTGHEDPGKPGSDLSWEALAATGGTLVMYMGVGRMRDNFARLIEGGRARDTPAAAIEWGTYPRQRTVTGTLETLPGIVEREGVGAPAIVVVGDVVSLRSQLAWFEARPLFGMRVVVTRARAQASGMARELAARGAEVVQFPTIRVEDPVDPTPLRNAVRGIDLYDWIVFTSANGVDRFRREMGRQGRDARALGTVRIAAIGPATGRRLGEMGIVPDLVPDEYVAERVLATLEAVTELDGARILLPRAAEAREVLPEGLRRRGARVDVVPAYRTVPDGANAGELRDRLAAGGIDLITFTASSTVRNFVELVGSEIGEARVAAIGPITARTAREAGLPVHLVADDYTIPGLISAIVEERDRAGKG